MPRVTERCASAIAEDGQNGWILVEDPVASPGWYKIQEISRQQGWVSIDCGRKTPYVISAQTSLHWAPVEPPEIWWRPW